MPHPSTSLLPQNPTQAEDEEEGSPRGDDDMQINNRVAGGAGKRLSVEDLQVCCRIILATLHIDNRAAHQRLG